MGVVSSGMVVAINTTEWFDDDRNDVNDVLWGSQLLDNKTNFWHTKDSGFLNSMGPQ